MFKPEQVEQASSPRKRALFRSLAGLRSSVDKVIAVGQLSADNEFLLNCTTRRSFLRGSAIIGVAAMFAPDLLVPDQVRAEDMIISPGGELWPTPDWWPVFEKRAEELGLPTMHADWWPAHVFDLEYGAMGGVSNIQEQAIKKANIIRRNRPDTKDSAGYCPWVAIAQLLEPEPQAYPEESLAGETDPDRIKRLKGGLLTLKHSGDKLIRLEDDKPAKLSSILRNTVERGLPVVIDLPGNMGDGIYFRALIGISVGGRTVKATDFGRPNREFNISEIRQAYLVYTGSSSEDFTSRYRSVSFWRYRGLNREFIDWLVAGKPRPQIAR